MNNDNKIMLDKKLSPFKIFAWNNFPFIEDTFDSLTNYQLYCKIVDYLNDNIEKINQLGGTVQDYTNAFLQLKDYIDNYFNNLDVQDEINTKLDDMAEKGELTEIIAQYLSLNGVYAYNTIENMQEAENLISGSTCYCLGKNYYNDGIGNYYKIREIVNTDIVDGYNIVAIYNPNLVAERIENDLTSTVNKIKNSIGSHKLTSTRIFRKLLERHDYNYYSEPNNTLYFYTQGFCMINENTCAIALIPDNYQENSQATIQIINLSNGSVIKSVTGDFGHVNALSYNPDEKLLYCGGLAKYNNGQYVNSSEILVIDYDTMNYNIYDTGAITGTVSYDKVTKLLYTHFGTNLYQLNKDNYTIEKTISMDYKLPTGQTYQTVKVNNSLVYQVTAHPNIISIFDITGNNLNTIVLDEFADDMYYIEEIEDIDFLGDYIYFNSQGFIDATNYNLVNICKTSLIYNLASRQSSFRTIVGGSLDIYIDNTSNNINPNGLDNNKFYCLMEAVMFLNSPWAKKFSKQTITLAQTNNIYMGCRILNPNLRFLNCNGQVIGSTEIVGVNKLSISSATFKATSSIPNLKIVNSNVNIHRPFLTDLDNIVINKYGIYIENSNLELTDGSTADFSNDLKIYINGIDSNLKTSNYNIFNVVKERNYGNSVDKFILYDGTIDNSNNYNYSTTLTNINSVEKNKYKYINFVIDGVNKKTVIKMKIDGNYYRVNDWRMVNSISSNLVSFAQYTITLNDNNIVVENAKLVQYTGSTTNIVTSNIEIKIKQIYLSDN